MEKEQAFKNFKKFFESDIKIKETLYNLAPTELDVANEESRIEYTDKLYKELKSLEIEFTEIAKRFEFTPEVLEAIKTHFEKSKEAFLIGKYEPRKIKEIYSKQFSNMNTNLIEDVKSDFFGHGTSEDKIEENIKKAKSINELLHVMHSYIANNNKMMEELPVIKTKTNTIGEAITLYGEETEFSKKLFEEFPLELDCDCTEIVSMQDKVLMMVRSRGHALTIDVDVSEPDNAFVKYFIPKITNRGMIEALPGVNNITENGAMGGFQVSKQEIIQELFAFIEKVPTDMDNPMLQQYMQETQNLIQEEPIVEQIKEEIVQEYIAPEIEIDNENVFENRIEANIISKLKERIFALKNKVLNLFKKDKTLMLEPPKGEEKYSSFEEERKKFASELQKGVKQPALQSYENILEEPENVIENTVRDEERIN